MVIIIAECGINANGEIGLAKALMLKSKLAGADAVKFQKRTVEVVYEKTLENPRESKWGETVGCQKLGLEFNKEEYDEIDRYSKEIDFPWFASAWDIESQAFLQQYDCKYNKIASPMLTYSPLLEMVAEERKHTFISTGMSSLGDIRVAVDIFERHQCPFTLLHCYSVYPCKPEDCNVRMITTLRSVFGCAVGYSGHEVGIDPTIAAVTLGATVIERHITLDRAMEGSDQAASVENFRALVEHIRATELCLGDGQKWISPEELAVAEKLRWFES